MVQVADAVNAVLRTMRSVAALPVPEEGDARGIKRYQSDFKALIRNLPDSVEAEQVTEEEEENRLKNRLSDFETRIQALEARSRPFAGLMPKAPELLADSAGGFEVGMELSWPVTADPPNARWKKSDGTTYNIANYPTAGALFGSTHGGDGVTTFAVPDRRERVIVGAGTNYTLGDTEGLALGARDATLNGTITTNATGDHGHNGSTIDPVSGYTSEDGTGATGGNNDNTDEPSAVTRVDDNDDGARVEVGSDTHTHPMNNHTHTGPAHTHEWGPVTPQLNMSADGEHSHTFTAELAHGVTNWIVYMGQYVP